VEGGAEIFGLRALPQVRQIQSAKNFPRTWRRKIKVDLAIVAGAGVSLSAMPEPVFFDVAAEARQYGKIASRWRRASDPSVSALSRS
jgi:hypothetical protein